MFVRAMESDRPVVFISYAHKDAEFVARVISDLQSAGLDVWHDVAEIRPGESIRDRIMEHGLKRCDVVFVYYSEPAAQSAWVKREIDAASVRDIGTAGGIFALFVDAKTTRARLPLDLQALNVPVFTSEHYCRPLASLISRAWSRFAAARVSVLEREHAGEVSRLAVFRDALFDLVQMHKQLPVFRSFEWTHTILPDGDGITEARVSLTTEELPMSWWRVHLGATDAVAGPVTFADIGFTASDDLTNESLRTFALRDDVHDKDVVILFPRLVRPHDTFTLRTRHRWPRTWRVLKETGTESSRFSIERPTDFVSLTFVFPPTVVPVAFQIVPNPAGSEMTIDRATVRWSASNPAVGRYDWKLVVRAAF